MKLKRVYSKHFPFQGYVALTICPWVFIREEEKKKYTEKVYRHETTHALQQIECLWILFFLLYGVEYLVKLICTFSHKRAYKSISFEQEAYNTENISYYNDIREHYAWVRYIFKLKEK